MNPKLRFFDVHRLLEYLLPALVVTLGLQMLRVLFVSLAWYLRDTVGISAMDLAPYAFGTFAFGFLAAGLRRLAGPRLALWLTASGASAARVIEQLSTDPAFDLWLTIAGMAFFLMFLPIFLGHLRARGERVAARWAYGLTLGLGFDIALRGVFGALDLSWIPGPIPVVVIGLLALLLLWSLAREPASDPHALSETAWSQALPMLAIGPYLLLQLLLYESQGWIEVVAGLADQTGFLIVMAGNLAAALGIAWGLSRPRSFHPILALAIGIYLTVAVATADQRGGRVVLTILIGQGLMGWGWALLGRTTRKAEVPGLARSTVALAGGMILFLALAFGYYVALDMALPFPRTAVPPAAAALLGLLYLAAAPRHRSAGVNRAWELTGVSVAGLLVLVPLVHAALTGPAPTPQPPSGLPIKVMTYNIHSGFGSEGRQDPEAIARIIAASGADIVGLQEVSRVRLLDGEADLPVWLSRRLDMPMLFQGTEEPTWGNALLSRFPVLASGWSDLPRDGTLIGRGYLWALIDIGEADPLLVIDTHLHHIEEDSIVRQAQVPVLMQFWDGRIPAVLLGDLNAEPESPEMELIAQAGLVDSWAEAGSGPGYTFSARDPLQRIDWIWHSDDMAAVEAQVISTLASDHLPVVATLHSAP